MPIDSPPRNRVERRHPNQARLAYLPTEVADLIGQSRAQIYTYMADGSLPSIKLGRSRRILHDDLIAFLESRRAAS